MVPSFNYLQTPLRTNRKQLLIEFYKNNLHCQALFLFYKELFTQLKY